MRCLLAFKMSLPINPIILFVQTHLRMWNMHKHKRRDLLHEPITAEYNQSSPIISRWRHCLLSCDCLPFISPPPPPPPTNSMHALGGLLKLSGLRGSQRDAEIFTGWCRRWTMFTFFFMHFDWWYFRYLSYTLEIYTVLLDNGQD